MYHKLQETRHLTKRAAPRSNDQIYVLSQTRTATNIDTLSKCTGNNRLSVKYKLIKAIWGFLLQQDFKYWPIL